MLRITQNSARAGSGAAKSYYTSADYYTRGQELEGVWRGSAASRLGLDGPVRQPDWEALCDNLHPRSGTPLTPRRRLDRRVGYDFNFHAPKSLSLLYGLTRDERLLKVFREAVDATMQDMEAEVQTRVRSGGRNTDRTTGNLVWGEFVHFTARPVDGVPDPHLHAHCFAFNSTWDSEESRWKAAQFASVKRDAPFFEAVFHSRLARRLEELGLKVERSRHGWELAGIPASALRKFSRRTALIEKRTQEQGITDPHSKGELGAKTRERKRKDLSLDELRAQWSSRLAPEELAALAALKARVGSEGIAEDGRAAGEAVALALDHGLERSSVLPERVVMAHALKHSVGKSAPESVADALGREDLVRAEREGRRFVTTREVLAEERRLVAFAREGRGACAPLKGTTHVFSRDWLNAGQRRAVEHVLTSRDRVVLVRGAAGVGKTSMMLEAVEAIQSQGHKVFAFAPSAGASRGVLREEGFAAADTVARLLIDEELQSEVRNQVIWIDEAGLLGTRTLAQVFDLADRLDARVVLSGDRRQHGSVERGAALRLLEEHAGLVPAEIKDIQRQRGDYKRAVQALSEGRTAQGLAELDRLGWIKEVDQAERYRALATEYIDSVTAGKTALVVSPTHLEGEWITDEIRAGLKRQGLVAKIEHRFGTLDNANLTEAQRADRVNYEPGDVLVFHQNAKGYTRGQRVVVGPGVTLPLDQARRFQVFRPGLLPLAVGDRVRITRNGTTLDGLHRLNNGAVHTVKAFTPKGDLVLDNGWQVARDYGHLAHGYCLTSHSAQGKTVDRVIIGQSSVSLPASSREQFYVSVSRGRERATIYTDDKRGLLEAVGHSDERLSATEMTQSRSAPRRGRRVRQRPAEPVPTPARREEYSYGRHGEGRGGRDKREEGLTHER